MQSAIGMEPPIGDNYVGVSTNTARITRAKIMHTPLGKRVGYNAGSKKHALKATAYTVKTSKATNYPQGLRPSFFTFGQRKKMCDGERTERYKEISLWSHRPAC